MTDTRNEVMGVVTRKDLMPAVLEANVQANAKGGGRPRGIGQLKRKSSNKVLAEHSSPALFVKSQSML